MNLRSKIGKHIGMYLSDTHFPRLNMVTDYAEQVDDDLDLGHRSWVNVYYYGVDDPFSLECWTFDGTLDDLVDEIDRYYAGRL